MAWVCPLCGEINDNDESWDCADCGKRKPGVPEMDAPLSVKPTGGATPYPCLRCSGALKLASFTSSLGTVTLQGEKSDVREVKVYVCEECGELAWRAPR